MMSMLDVAAFTVVVFEWCVHTFFAFTLFAVFDGVVVIPQRRMIKKISFITMVLVDYLFFKNKFLHVSIILIAGCYHFIARLQP